MLQPNLDFDIKIKNTDFSDITDNVLETLHDKSVSLFFCKLSPSSLERIIQVCKSLSIVDTVSEETLELSQKYETNQNVSFFLTHLSYQQYGEYCHQLKMMIEQSTK